MDFNTLIGLEEFEAKQILTQNGLDDIETIINAKIDERCNRTLVCAVRQTKNHITLICGRFYILEK